MYLFLLLFFCCYCCCCFFFSLSFTWVVVCFFLHSLLLAFFHTTSSTPRSASHFGGSIPLLLSLLVLSRTCSLSHTRCLFSASSFAVRVIVICLLCIFKMSQRTGISRGKWWCYRHRMLPYFICLNTMHLMWTILFEGRSRNVNMLSKQEKERIQYDIIIQSYV